MFCNKCGNEVNENQQYCNKCGNLLTNYNINNSTYQHKKSKKTIPIIISTSIIIGVSLGAFFYIKSFINKNDYYFSEENPINNGNQTISKTQNDTNSTKGKYKTAIITDNVYTGITINSIEDANNLISQDSLKQKQSDYPEEIIQIENDIIQKYSITAVNLKEMNVEYAKELENVIKVIYSNYPKARGYLTNLTLTNLDMSEANVIALFMPMFTFGTSNTNTTRPWVIKTQVQLNAKYFLNPERIDAAVQVSSKSGHFPANSTRYSPVAHEFGHYLSFIALLNYYYTDSIVVVEDNEIESYYNIMKDFSEGNFSKKMLEEAYQNYVQDVNQSFSFDEWRGQISQYALAKDEAGNYIYDETIAEAFHDVYLNNENAKTPSKYIVEVLKKYIER